MTKQGNAPPTALQTKNRSKAPPGPPPQQIKNHNELHIANAIKLLEQNGYIVTHNAVLSGKPPRTEL